MKKYMLSAFAVTLAIVAVSFTNATTAKFAENCSSGEFYFFEVQSPILCDEITENNLPALKQGPQSSGTTAAHAQADLPLSSNTDYVTSASLNKWGCEDVSTYCCAVGFKFADLERAPVLPGETTGRWRPKSTITQTICIVEKTNP